MDEACIQVAGVAEVNGLQFFAALVQGKKLEVCRGMIEPGHSLGRRSPDSGVDDDLESAEVTAAVAVLTAMIEPENAESENAVGDRGGFCFTYADDCVSGGSAKQTAAHISRAETVLQVHRRTESIYLGADEAAGEDPLEQPKIVSPC